MPNIPPTYHSMQRRMTKHDYALPGIYHITMHVAEDMGQPLGQVNGSLQQPDNTPDGPHVTLTQVGTVVREELLNSITRHYSMISIDTYVIMPEHLHAIINVTAPIVSSNGHSTHLGQVIAGFKKGCNRRYWALTGQDTPAGKPLNTVSPAPSTSLAPSTSSAPSTSPAPSAPRVPSGSPAGLPSGSPAPSTSLAPSASPAPSAPRVPSGSPAGLPSGSPAGSSKRVPSSGTTGRKPLFAYGYCDVQPITPEQLATQRAYIMGNPRSRLLRTSQRDTLSACRKAYTTALTPSALRGFLQRECLSKHATPEALTAIEHRLLLADGKIALDTYGNRQLLNRRMLPVVCHRKDKPLFTLQRQRCLEEAARGTILVSPRIASGEQEIINEAVNHGLPVIIIADNGFPERYHPSTERLNQCAADQLLLVTPWQYQYRGKNEQVTIPFCKAMNCVAQALCRQKDNWWKAPE